MIVVFDTNTIVQAIFWPRSTARRALVGLALRRFKTALSSETLAEYTAVTLRFRSRFPKTEPAGALAWIAAKSVMVEPAPLGRPRSRDAADDMFVATGLAARATYIVAQDRDLLALGKPFGIRIVTPAEFLRLTEPRH
ncbi:MAG: putative toxin-antitoxin system toxin component, PIN family [Verrucomicrobia bacterium]|nr:putative toxin-antitoxin system toxin component, PIN family [Verrucomicrobiota bacterium]